MRPGLSPLLFAAALACASREPEGQAPAKPVEPPPAPASAAPDPSASPAPSPPAVTDEPRVYAKTRFVWIHPEPNGVGWTGFLWFGGSAKLKEPEPKVGSGCTKWYAIEPRGYVCADGVRATLDPNDPELRAMRPYAPDVSSPWPHRYAESRGVFRYPEIPKHAEQRLREWDLADHLSRVEAAKRGEARHESLVGVDLTPATSPAFSLGKLPSTVHEPRKRLTPLSTVAYSAEVAGEDRTWLLSADLLWVPKDRVVPYKQVTFRGVQLGRDAKLPLAFFRSKDRGKFKEEGGRLVETAERFERLSFVELTAAERSQDGAVFLETRQPGIWVKKSDAVVPTPQEKTPWGAPVNGEDTKEGPAGRRTWIESSVWEGWMIAYEGTRPVFATLIAPGRGGTPQKGVDPIDTAATPVGTFPITGKFATATMVAPGEFVHSDVPWAQNFSGPHALHGAYWHDDWGDRKSGGCVNVSPIDGKWLFEFTEPPIPEGWHGVRWRPNVEPATTFVVHN
ncbi:MAG: hypothetical protein AMXMBFR56_32260 [Polyangiaceae bacterium]